MQKHTREYSRVALVGVRLSLDYQKVLTCVPISLYYETRATSNRDSEAIESYVKPNIT